MNTTPIWLRVSADWAWRLLVVAIAFVAAVYVLVRLRLVVIPAIAALFLATLFVPPATWLRRRGVPRVAAAATVFVVGISAVSILVTLLIPQVTSEFGEVGRVARKGADEATRLLEASPLGIDGAQITEFVSSLGERARDNASPIAKGLLAGALTAFEFVAGMVLMLFMAFFFVADGERMGATVLELFPRNQKGHVREMAHRAWSTLGSYLRGVAVIALVDAVAIGTGLAIIGVPLVLPLSILVFLGAFLPLVGAFSAGAIAVLVALVTSGPVDALFVFALILGVQQVEGHVLTPLVLGRATQLHPVLVIVVLTAGAVLGGIVGAFVAVPIAAVVGSIVSYWRSPASHTPQPQV